MDAIEAVQTMQLAIAMFVFVALDFWFPPIKRICSDLRNGTDQVILIVPLWRILIGTCGAVVGAIAGFFPYIILNLVVAFGFDVGDRPLWPTALGQLFLFFLMMWFASWGKAATDALRNDHPSPWHSEHFLDWRFVLWTGTIVLIAAFLLVKLQNL